MKRLFSILVLGACASLSLSASTISFDSVFNTFSNAPQNVSVNFNLLGSIPVGSTINSVTVELLPSAQLTSSATVTNNDTQAGTLASFQLTNFNFTLSVPDFALQQYNGTDRNQSQSIGVSPASANFAAVTNLFSNVLGTLVAGDCLDGSCTYTIDKNGASVAETTGGNFSATVITQVQGTLRFTYDYTPDEETPIPEPTTVFMVGSALLGLGLMGRRRYQK